MVIFCISLIAFLCPFSTIHFTSLFAGIIHEDSLGTGGVGNTNIETLDEVSLQKQIQLKLDQEQLERDVHSSMGHHQGTHATHTAHDQHSYQSHDSHTNSYTGTLNSCHSARSQQHSPHSSAGGSAAGSSCIGANEGGGYVTPTPPPIQPHQHQTGNDYDSSHHSSSMNSSQHSSSHGQNPFPQGNQIIVQDQRTPDLLK